MDKRMLSKGLIFGLLTVASVAAHADAPGGNGCGWGNMLFDGQRGLAPSVLGMTTNGTSGHATFGVTSGTNGCTAGARIGYSGRSMLAMNGMLDSIAVDMAQGQGEALDAYAVLLGVPAEHRAQFAKVTHDNFNQIFSAPDVTSEQVLTATMDVMSRDPQLATYAKTPA